MSLNSPWQGILTLLGLIFICCWGKDCQYSKNLGEENIYLKQTKISLSAQFICNFSMSFAVFYWFTEDSSHAGSYPSKMTHVLWPFLLINLTLSALFILQKIVQLMLKTLLRSSQLKCTLEIPFLRGSYGGKRNRNFILSVKGKPGLGAAARINSCISVV